MIFELNLFLAKYQLFDTKISGYAWIGACSLSFAILCGVLLIEQTFLKVAIAYFGNNVFSGRIGDANLKLSILHRLYLYAEAVYRRDMSIVDKEIQTGIEIIDSFLLNIPGFRLRSYSNCQRTVEKIFSMLEVSALTKDHIKKAFGRQHRSIWRFLTDLVFNEGATEDKIRAITQENLISIAKKTFTEHVDIKRTLYDRDLLIGKLSTILGGFAVAITITLSTPAFGFDTFKSLAGILPLIVSCGWIFSDIIQEVFHNFIFLLHVHPFDVGDKIHTKGEELVVLRIDLMYSTFTSKGGTVCYIPNRQLINEKIFNVRRSDIQTSIVTLVVEKDLTAEEITNIKTKIDAAVKAKEMQAKNNIVLQDYDAEEKKTKVVFRIEHYSNFQGPELKYNRNQKPLEIIHKTIRDAGYVCAEHKTVEPL